MTPEELLMPRYKVIADYPNSLFKVGETLKEGIVTKDYIFCDPDGPRWSQFPHLFRKLNWWEERKVEDMPEYVKSLADDRGTVFKIQKWDMGMLIGWIDYDKRQCASLETFKPEYGYFPATEQEYNDYINSKSNAKP